MKLLALPSLFLAVTSRAVVTAWISSSSSSSTVTTHHSSTVRALNTALAATSRSAASPTENSAWFIEVIKTASLERSKAQVLQLGAALDRGQAYNPTSGPYYEDTMKAARRKIEELIGMAEASNVPTKLEEMEGEWELVLSTVPHGIFRSR